MRKVRENIDLGTVIEKLERFCMILLLLSWRVEIKRQRKVKKLFLFELKRSMNQIAERRINKRRNKTNRKV